MKIRQGFVSNSSSSSFIAGFPEGLSDKEKKQILLKKMGVKEGGLFFNVANQMADCIIYAEEADLTEIANDYGYDRWAEMVQQSEDTWITQNIQNCIDKKFQVYYGSAANYSYDTGEVLFCDIEWHVDDDDFFICKEASF